MIVIDELSSFKNHNTKRFKSLLKVRPKVSRIVGLTGTPASNGLMDLWAEFRILDMGQRLGRFITKYRTDYFMPDKRNGQIIYSYKPLPYAEDAIYRQISDITISMKSTDHLQMPELVSSEYIVRLSDSEQEDYEDLKRELVLTIPGGEITAANAASLSGKLSQLANGAIYDDAGDVHNIHDRKLDALEDIIEAAKSDGDMQAELDALDAEIKAHNATLDEIKTQLKTLRGKTVETDTAKDSINLMLRDSGMRGFSLEPKAGVDNVYEVRRPDGTIADNLSEGEKNFIAFLYFYHLVHGSDSADGETREKIVVIDDPVSSMDSGSLFIVSTLVRQMIEICRNNADNRNRTAEGNFIKQIFILTHNAYFHREVSYSYVAKYDYASFYLIRKIGTKSTIKLCDDVNPNAPTERINVNPVKNSYAALWDEYKEVQSAVPLMNVIRRILEYYFLQLCGYEGSQLRQVILIQGKAEGRFKDADGNDDEEKFQLASSMLAYINASSIGMSDGMDFVEDCLDADECRSIFEMIFDAMKQKQHYDMMMGNQ